MIKSKPCLNNLALVFVLLSVIQNHTFAKDFLDTTFLKCSYRFTDLKDTITKIQEDDLLILQIGRNVSKCYSYYTFQSDSLISSPDGWEKWEQLFNAAIKRAKGGTPEGFPYTRMKACVYKNYPSGKMTVTDGISLQDYIYEDSLNTQSWEIRDSIKTLLDYSCQKAVCRFRGREWTAWFASEVPVSDGPWKLCGLPGLIMEAYDRGKQYHFVIEGLQKVEEPIVFGNPYAPSAKFEKTTRKKFLKAEKRYLMDTNGFIKLETGIDLGTDAPPEVMRYDLLERDY